MSERARVESVNVGAKRTVEWGGRMVETGIWKSPIEGPVSISGVNLAGDDQADRRVHGGPDKAVYAYSKADYEFWSDALGTDLQPGTFGENLTVSGLDLEGAQVGERWRVGTATLEVTQPRLPCYKLGIRMGDATFPDRFDDEGRLGVYLRIQEEGTLQAGDEIELIHRPDHGLTAYDIARSYPDPSPDMVDLVLSVKAVPTGWRDWAVRARGRSAG